MLPPLLLLLLLLSPSALAFVPDTAVKHRGNHSPVPHSIKLRRTGKRKRAADGMPHQQPGALTRSSRKKGSSRLKSLMETQRSKVMREEKMDMVVIEVAQCVSVTLIDKCAKKHEQRFAQEPLQNLQVYTRATECPRKLSCM